ILVRFLRRLLSRLLRTHRHGRRRKHRYRPGCQKPSQFPHHDFPLDVAVSPKTPRHASYATLPRNVNLSASLITARSRRICLAQRRDRNPTILRPNVHCALTLRSPRFLTLSRTPLSTSALWP